MGIMIYALAWINEFLNKDLGFCWEILSSNKNSVKRKLITNQNGQ